MKRYEQLLQIVRECDYRVLEGPAACGCEPSETRCLLGRGGWARDRHLVNPNDCLACTKGGENGRVVAADPEVAKGDDGVADPGDEPPGSAHRDGAKRLGPMVLESGIEREILRLERELFELQLAVRSFRFPDIEQQLASLWYNPNPCTTPNFVLSASPSSPQNSGTNITFTMTDSDSPLATGSVQFLDGSTNIGALQALAGGIASVSTSSLSVATHTINVNYGGDATYCSGTKSINYQITGGSNFTVSGKISGCGSFGIPSCTVVFTDTTDTITYGTFVTASDGTYSGSGSANIPSNPTSVHMHLTPGDSYAARFVTTVSSVTLAFGANTRNATISTNASYHCSVYFYFPLNSTLSVNDSTIGNNTITWNGVNGWTLTFSYNYPGCSGCSAVAGLSLTYSLPSAGGGFTTGYKASLGCPNSSGSGTSDLFNPMVATSSSPPTIAKTITGDNLYCSSSVTITVKDVGPP